MLDDLSQQEVNPRLLALDQGVLEVIQVGNAFVIPHNTMEASLIQMDTNLGLVDSIGPKVFVAIRKIEANSFLAKKVRLDLEKGIKDSPSLGLQ